MTGMLSRVSAIISPEEARWRQGRASRSESTFLTLERLMKRGLKKKNKKHMKNVGKFSVFFNLNVVFALSV